MPVIEDAAFVREVRGRLRKGCGQRTIANGSTGGEAAAARVVAGYSTLIDGVNIVGLDPFTLHEDVTQPGARGMRRSH
jgi:hypothetical protein